MCHFGTVEGGSTYSGFTSLLSEPHAIVGNPHATTAFPDLGRAEIGPVGIGHFGTKRGGPCGPPEVPPLLGCQLWR